MFEKLFRSGAPEQHFWKWFQKHELRLFDFETEREQIFDLLQFQLRRINSNLTFEFGPKQRGKREFVISAGGIREAFPAVTALAAASPNMARWHITAFRPRRWPINEIELRGVTVNPKDIQVSILDNGEIPGVYLYIPGYVEEEIVWKEVGYLLLDEALGEFDVETNLGLVRMLPPEAVNDFERIPLSELPYQFDLVVANLRKRLSSNLRVVQ
jgi:hypothetical protein